MFRAIMCPSSGENCVYAALVTYTGLINTLRKHCAPSWLYLQVYTGMHGEQNIKSVFPPLCLTLWRRNFF